MRRPSPLQPCRRAYPCSPPITRRRVPVGQGVLGAKGAAGEPAVDGPLPFGGTLCPVCSPICEIHADLWPGSRCHTVLLRPKRIRLPIMSTIELVDPELREAL